MQDMKVGPILLRQVECVKEGYVGVLRKIRTVQDVFIGNDELSLSILTPSIKSSYEDFMSFCPEALP